MATLEQLKDKVQTAKDNYTKAVAIMGEITSNIEKEAALLKDLGVAFPTLEECADEAEWHTKIIDATKAYIQKIEEDIETTTAEVEQTIKKWEDE